METSVLFTEVLYTKFVGRGNTYYEEHGNGMFIDGIPATIQTAAIMFQGLEKGANFLETARYADTLLKQVRHSPSLVVTQN